MFQCLPELEIEAGQTTNETDKCPGLGKLVIIYLCFMEGYSRISPGLRCDNYHHVGIKYDDCGNLLVKYYSPDTRSTI